MKNFYLFKILCFGILCISHASWSQNSNIIHYGFPDSILSESFPSIEKYENSTASPHFIDWGLNGKTLLFDEDSLLVKRRINDGGIVSGMEVVAFTNGKSNLNLEIADLVINKFDTTN